MNTQPTSLELQLLVARYRSNLLEAAVRTNMLLMEEIVETPDIVGRRDSLNQGKRRGVVYVDMLKAALADIETAKIVVCDRAALFVLEERYLLHVKRFPQGGN